MSSVKVIHEAAMEYYDLAKQAKMRGDFATYKVQLEKAYVLEKEAALTMPEQPQNFMWRYILLRSAGWLAYHCGFFEEAKKLAGAGLSGTPPEHEKHQLEELLSTAIKMEKLSPDTDAEGVLHFTGVFTSADVLQNNIVIRVNGKSQTVVAESEKIREVARLFLGDAVHVKVRKNEAGVTVLERIGRAA